jgi:hypothetical protein
VIELTTIYCPECGDAAEDMGPENEPDAREEPGYRHVGDRTALCPVLTHSGYRPAEPVEGDRDEADV